MTPLEDYLRELRDIRSTGAAVKETSYYPALARLFNDGGKTLKPKVRCVLTLANRGAGLPDGGLFTSDQFQKSSDVAPLPGQNPARGVIEIKSTGDDAWVTADSEQVTRYWRKYRQVLVTNYRDFVLVGQDAEGNAVKLESFRLAENEKAFWAATSTPRALAKNTNERFLEYIQRVMRHAVPIAAPEDVAWFLASYARDARARIEGVDLPALATVRAALEEALGLKFQGEKGEHFFRSSLVQTLFYGVFSAWVPWAKQHPGVAAGLSRHLQNGDVKSPLQNIAVPTRVGGGQLDVTRDFAVTAGWGHGGKGGITMPGKGRIVERDFTESERSTAVPAVGPHGQDAHATLGARTCDVYLNDVAYWKNVPIRVWEYTIGGYQVMKKWLS